MDEEESMKQMVYTLGAVAVISGALGAHLVLSGSNTSTVAVVMTETVDTGKSGAPVGDTKRKLGDEVACAVDGMKMPLSADTPSAEYGGKVYYFCGDSEKQEFLRNPERYVHH
jgi:YHS domain-containing protein